MKIISEKDFMEGLENIASIDSGEIDEKLVIIRYKALFKNDNLDIDGLEEFLSLVHETSNSHVSASIEEPFIYQDLYNEFSNEQIDNLLFFQCRIVKNLENTTNSQEFVDALSKGFEAIKGLDGDLTWTDKKERTASFAKLLKDIPLKTKLRKIID